jgi:hypothetical protein
MTPTPDGPPNTPTVPCPQCAAPLRAVAIASGGPDGSMTVRAACDRCARQWCYPHWDLVVDSAKVRDRMSLVELIEPDPDRNQ